MNKIDLIIENIEYAKILKESAHQNELLEEALAAARELKELAQPEQKLNDPPAYVEPPTSDYHNGWEEGFEAAKNLFKKESAPQNADPRLLLGRKDNCIALAQPEQEPVCDKDPFYCWSIRCQVGKICKHTAPPRKPWVGLTDEEVNLIYAEPQTHVGQYAKAIEAKLKEKNT